MAALPVPPAPAPGPDSTPLSQGARIVNTFIAPSKTFSDLRRRASWWAPYLLIAVVSIVFVWVVDQKATFRKVVENQIQLSPKATDRLEKLSAAERERAVQQQTTGTRYFSYCYWAFILLLNLIFAAVLFGTFKLGFSADMKFKTAFAIVMYASLPLMIKTLLAMVFLLAGINTDSFTFQNPVASNPGYFVNAAESPVLYSVASSLDIFTIWTLILTAIGFACAGKLKRSVAFAGVFGWYVVTVLLGAGIAAAFS